jgi:hypothetical protein
MIGPKTSIADRPHRMMWQNESAPVPDGDGGYTPGDWINLVPPTTSVSIEPATAKSLENVAAGTVLSTNMYIVGGPYHPQITTKSRGLFNGRIFNVVGVSNPKERNVDTIAVCVEIVA